MTLQELRIALDKLQAGGFATADSPVIIEGYTESEEWIQASVAGVFTEARCEDEDEPQGVYITLDVDPPADGEKP